MRGRVVRTRVKACNEEIDENEGEQAAEEMKPAKDERTEARFYAKAANFYEGRLHCCRRQRKNARRIKRGCGTKTLEQMCGHSHAVIGAFVCMHVLHIVIPAAFKVNTYSVACWVAALAYCGSSCCLFIWFFLEILAIEV